MIYESATLHEVPWEIIIKDSRKNLGEKKFGNIDGYANYLFDCIRYHYELFPKSYHEEIFERECQKIWNIVAYAVTTSAEFKAAAADADKQTVFANKLVEFRHNVDGLPLPAAFPQAELDDVLNTYCARVAAEIQKDVAQNHPTIPINVNGWAELVILTLCKNYKAVLENTGLVVAGYGEDDYFPSYEEYECHGLLLGKLLVEKKVTQKVELGRPAMVSGFATTAMVDTFLNGVSTDVYNVALDKNGIGLRGLGAAISADLGGIAIPNLDAHVAAIRSQFTKELSESALNAHYQPLIRVVALLPVDEMASLAETLVMLESLKEKVTRPTESVGGPVDVAVITKSEGFVWIKRKHYFDPTLNERFFQRQQAEKAASKKEPSA